MPKLKGKIEKKGNHPLLVDKGRGSFSTKDKPKEGGGWVWGFVNK